MRTMMVRILVDVPLDDRAKAETSMLESVRQAVLPLADRMWIAVDHPQPDHAKMLWSSIAANEDPNRPGRAAIYPTPKKPL
jgi:hypothetical protein